MLVQYLTLPYLSFLYACTCLARPPDPSQTPNLLSLNLTLPPTLRIFPSISAPNTRITCFTTGPRTTVDGCRPALNHIKEFPHYKHIQPFQEDRRPVLNNGHTPPLLVFARDANCAIEVASRDPRIVDAFSFQEVRALATEVVEECQHGGWSPIGRGVGWHVRVIGVDIGGGNGRVVGRGNGTVGVEQLRGES